MKRIIDRGIDFCLAMILLVMTVIVFIQVFFRYVLNNPLPWPEELARILIVWLTFIGAYVALREEKHIGFNILVKKLPPWTQAIVNAVGKILVAVFLLVMIWYGVLFTRKFTNVRMTYLGISRGWIAYSVFPISGMLMLLQTIMDLVRRRPRNITNPENSTKGL